MSKHLTLDDRISIQSQLKNFTSFADIATNLEKSPSTIMREIKKHRIFIDRHDVSTMQTKNVCKKRFDCSIKENVRNLLVLQFTIEIANIAVAAMIIVMNLKKKNVPSF